MKEDFLRQSVEVLLFYSQKTKTEAKVETKVNQHIRVEYIDEQGTPIKQATNLKGITGYSYGIDKADILNYSLIGVQKDISNINKPIIRFVYRKNPVQESTANNIARQNRAKRTRRSIQSNAVKTNRAYKAVTNSSAKSYTKPKSSKKDPFLVNTGMTEEEKKDFIQYLKEVEKNERKKYGNNKDKINHEVANAIMYPSYSKSFLQNHANNLIKPDVSKKTYKGADEILNKIHFGDNYPVDLSHMACPLGASEKSNDKKEVTKLFAGLPFLETGRDKFFYLNSYTGDFWTHLDAKDLRSDKDAFILKYHPKYMGKLYSRSIIEYYSQDNLEGKREKLFKEILKKQAGSGVTAEEQQYLNNFWATFTLGGAALIGMGLIEVFKGRRETLLKVIFAIKTRKNILANVLKIYTKKALFQNLLPKVKKAYSKSKKIISRILKPKRKYKNTNTKKRGLIKHTKKTNSRKKIRKVIKSGANKLIKTANKILKKKRV